MTYYQETFESFTRVVSLAIDRVMFRRFARDIREHLNLSVNLDEAEVYIIEMKHLILFVFKPKELLDLLEQDESQKERKKEVIQRREIMARALELVKNF